MDVRPSYKDDAMNYVSLFASVSAVAIAFLPLAFVGRFPDRFTLPLIIMATMAGVGVSFAIAY
jgi:hypothetical protein